jgi:proteic killer suppression protein
MITRVDITEEALKTIKKAPKHVVRKLLKWVDDVEARGVEEVRKQRGWHDEPLKGDRKGERSIRLNRQWRAIYVELKDGTIDFLEVREVTPHDY